jgi:nitrate/TMAO reductase-like tetraheme cytochrome c subunit
MKDNMRIWIWITVIIVGGGLLFAGVEYSSSSGFCAFCHSGKAGNTQSLDWAKSTHANPDRIFNPMQQEVGCAECHIPKDIPGFTQAKLNGMKDAIYWFTLDKGPAKRRYQPNVLPDTTCLECHKDVVNTSEFSAHELSDAGEERIALIGLRYDHKIHMQVANEVCSECHSTKENYFARNYLSCARCHASVAHNSTQMASYTGPGKPYSTSVPSAEQCDACHTGRLHVNGTDRLSRMAEISMLDAANWTPAFFQNDCPRGVEREQWWQNPTITPGSNCAKCHPTIEEYVNSQDKKATDQLVAEAFANTSAVPETGVK